MEFCKDRVFTSLNADELRAGDKVVVADNMAVLRDMVIEETEPAILIDIEPDHKVYRFMVKGDNCHFALAYLVERAENCTNCDKAGCYDCVSVQDPEAYRCEDYKPITKQKAEKKICLYCNHYSSDFCSKNHHVTKNDNRACADFDNTPVKKIDRKVYEYYNTKTEPYYRPFRDTDELIKVWCEHKCPAHNHRERGLTMPLIWIRRKNDPKDKGRLITAFNDDCVEIGEAGSGDVLEVDGLFEIFEFLDGSVCGVEE